MAYVQFYRMVEHQSINIIPFCLSHMIKHWFLNLDLNIKVWSQWIIFFIKDSKTRRQLTKTSKTIHKAETKPSIAMYFDFSKLQVIQSFLKNIWFKSQSKDCIPFLVLPSTCRSFKPSRSWERPPTIATEDKKLRKTFLWMCPKP